ncbi:MAG: hypothetical protein ACLFS5_00740 [Spirochaetaceae bacterium]
MGPSRTTALLVLLVACVASRALPQEPVLLDPVLGFDGSFSPGSWVPFRATFVSPEGPFDGEVTVDLRFEGGTAYRAIHHVRTAGAGTQPVEIILPAHSQEVRVEAGVTDGTTTDSRWETTSSEELRRFVLVLGRVGSLDLLHRIRGTLAEDARIVYVEPAELPTEALGLDAADTVVLYNAALTQLREDSVRALNTWIRRGGRLITIGGAHLTEQDAAAITKLLPGKIAELEQGVPAAWSTLFPFGIVDGGSRVRYSHLEPTPGARRVPETGPPLVAYEDRGKGTVEFVATDIRTLGGMAMSESGLWREAFSPLPPAGRIRFPTAVGRRMQDSLAGNAVMSGRAYLLPGRGTLMLAGIGYIIIIALLTRRLARSRSPSRIALIGPAAVAVAVSGFLLLGASRGTWIAQTFLGEGEVFRAAASAHRDSPTPGVLEKDILVASRIEEDFEGELPEGLQPVPRHGQAVTVREDGSRRSLLVPLERNEQRSYYVQGALELHVTAELYASASGVRLSLHNGSGFDLEDAHVLWNRALFALGDISDGSVLRTALSRSVPERAIRRQAGTTTGRVLRSIRQSAPPPGPVLVAFLEEPLAAIATPEHYRRRGVSVVLLSLQQPAFRGAFAGRNSR